MSNQYTQKIDLNELIFAFKNREYGAYVLRKLYKKHLSIAMWVAVIFFALAVSAPIIINYLTPKEDLAAINRKKKITLAELAEPPSIDKKQEVQQQVEAPPPLKSTIKFLPPVVKPDEQVTEEYIPTVDELKNIDPGAKTQEGQAGGVDYSLIDVQDNAATQEVVEEKQEAEVFTYVEEMPTFPGGDEEVLRFISQNVQYPEIAKRAGVEGRVMVSFVVNPSGDLSGFKVVKGIGAGCDEEAIRVCKMMPRWKAGRQNGKPVSVRVVIPFLFKLQ